MAVKARKAPPTPPKKAPVVDLMAGLDTVDEAREKLDESRLAKSGTCPVCRRPYHGRNRRLSAEMVRGLMALVRAQNDGVDLHAMKMSAATGLSGGDYAKLRYFGFVTSPRRGFLIPTKKAIDFMLGRLGVPAYVFVSADGKWSPAEPAAPIVFLRDVLR